MTVGIRREGASNTKTELGAEGHARSAERRQGKRSVASHRGTAGILHLPSKMLYLRLGWLG